MPTHKNNLTTAIVGSGATTIYLLKHLLDRIQDVTPYIKKIIILEKDPILGTGMPYSPLTTDKYNLANISSEEIPDLEMSFTEWLRGLSQAELSAYEIKKESISDSAVYSRLALGQYFQNRFHYLVLQLKNKGVAVEAISDENIIDIISEELVFHLKSASGKTFESDNVIIATGHIWQEKDKSSNSYYACPWPISKILPKKDQYFNFPIGILGASLSAFDVVTSLSHRHGTFEEKDDITVFMPFEGTENFKISLHSMQGWLPHLQYEQKKAIRSIYRHTTREDLLELLDEQGFLRIESYFNEVCKPALIKALNADGLNHIAEKLLVANFGLEEFVSIMSERHEYKNPFEGMKLEMVEARNSIENNKPIHWKEVVDDLMYCLNYHAELMPAEDHIIFHRLVMPFLLNVISALPLSSAKILLALYEAGKLDMVSGEVEIINRKTDRDPTRIQVTDGESVSSITYKMFISCGGQQSIEISNFPFQGLVEKGLVSLAQASFMDGKAPEKMDGLDPDKIINDQKQSYQIGGIAIDASYRILNNQGKPVNNLFDVAFTHTLGIRPYSYGLQACSATTEIMVERWTRALSTGEKIKEDVEEVSKTYQENPQL